MEKVKLVKFAYITFVTTTCSQPREEEYGENSINKLNGNKSLVKLIFLPSLRQPQFDLRYIYTLTLS